MDNKELQKILLLHKDWLLSNGADGSRANLHDANLQRANLHRTKIDYINLSVSYGLPIIFGLTEEKKELVSSCSEFKINKVVRSLDLET